VTLSEHSMLEYLLIKGAKPTVTTDRELVDA